MDKETYYLKLQELLDKVKNLKRQISESDDKEKIKYLKLATNLVNEEIRLLMDKYNKLD